jgi:hypothetical protein
MHPQKEKSKVIYENVIEKLIPLKPMHNEQFKKLMTTISSSTLKDIKKKILINNFALLLKFIQVYSHLCHLHKQI